MKKPDKLIQKKAPKRYRYSYNDLYTSTDTKLEWVENNGYPEEQDMARGIRAERKRMRLATYGY